jgi:hypothetical protein
MTGIKFLWGLKEAWGRTALHRGSLTVQMKSFCNPSAVLRKMVKNLSGHGENFSSLCLLW